MASMKSANPGKSSFLDSETTGACMAASPLKSNFEAEEMREYFTKLVEMVHHHQPEQRIGSDMDETEILEDVIDYIKKLMSMLSAQSGGLCDVLKSSSHMYSADETSLSTEACLSPTLSSASSRRSSMEDMDHLPS